MRIAIVASEGVPFSKTGGLADVSGALFKVFASKGHETYLVLPYYKQTKRVLNSFDKVIDIEVELGSERKRGRALISEFTKKGFVVAIENDEYFDRDSLYGEGGIDYPDNAERFAFFCKSVIELVSSSSLNVDILHLNDWQTGLIPVFVREKRLPVRTLYTIHNLAYQGNFQPETIQKVGLNPELFTIDGFEFYGMVSYMKAGIVFSDRISTVSPSYAEEILTAEFGERLEGILRTRKDHLMGILNGIDTDMWNPANDPHIFKDYDAMNIEGKLVNKVKLMEEVGLSGKEWPLYGMVSRIAPQKGFDILSEALKEFLKDDVSIVVLGTGDKLLETSLRSLSVQYPEKLKIVLGFDDKLAHKIYAGSDFFVMPSRYEPCGLGQMIALRYGTLPIVHEVGGLKDTIDNYNEFTRCGNGFSFSEYSASALLAVLRRAKDIFGAKQEFARLQKMAMACDFSWDASAEKYISLFREMMNE